jgi:50S ribosomal protein L16 3-hydroxylase
MSGSSRTGLDLLLHPLGVGQFADEYWPDRPLVAHGALGRFGWLAEEPALRDAAALFAAGHGAVEVFSRDPDGTHRQDTVETAADVAARYHAGGTVYVHGLERASERLAAWAREVASDLGLSLPACVLSAFASREGAGTAPHFDAQETFVVQLRGRKRWSIARNRHVDGPMENHVMGRPPRPSITRVASGELPAAMPEDAETLELGPGSLLFLPRGSWHTTTSLEDSLHLDVVVPVVTWADELAQMIRDRLLRHARWRGTAAGVRGQGPLARWGRARWSSLLDHFEADVEGLAPDDPVDPGEQR